VKYQNFHLGQRNIIKTLADYVRVFIGIAYFYTTHKNLSSAYLAMIRLHCLTSGKFTRFLGKVFALINPYKSSVMLGQSTFKNFSQPEISEICRAIEKNGFYVIENFLSPEQCDELLEIAKNSDSIPDNEPDIRIKIKDIAEPTSRVYRQAESGIIQKSLVQMLMKDPFFYEVLGKYLRSTPVLCSVNMWWSTLAKPSNGDKEAQNYHFDMSRARWLNFFIYLTDVDEASGPHCYVRGSNKIPSGSPGHELLKRGYARIPDSDIEQAFGKDQIVEMTAKRGTLIIEDTIGFHRGKPPVTKERFMFELVFSNSLFGGSFTEVKVDSVASPVLHDAVNSAPYTFQRYIIS
jgi:hypothetical protein